MKAAFFSVFALAMSALAAPVTESSELVARDGGVQTTDTFNELFDTIGARSLAEDVEHSSVEKRSVANSAALITTLQTCHTDITTQCGYVSGLVDKYKAGTITKTECATQSVTYFNKCVTSINVVVSACSGTGLLTIVAADVTIVVNLVIAIVTLVLNTVKLVVGECGLIGGLSVVIAAIIAIVVKLLIIIVAIVPALLSVLLSALNSLVLGLGLLGVLLTPLTVCLVTLSLQL